MTADTRTDDDRKKRRFFIFPFLPWFGGFALTTALFLGMAGAVLLWQFNDVKLDEAHASINRYKESVALFEVKHRVASQKLADVQNALGDAGLLLEESDGQVGDSGARQVLADAIAAVEADIAGPKGGIASTKLPKGRPGSTWFDGGAQFLTAADSIDGLVFPEFDEHALIAKLAGPAQATADAVAAAGGTVSNGQGGFGPGTGPIEGSGSAGSGSAGGDDGGVGDSDDPGFIEYVNTAGWQPEVDACKGSVDVTAHYKVKTVAEHWSCGGKNFPQERGAKVTFTGGLTGQYRVLGIVARANGWTDDARNLPKRYDVLYQTCWDGKTTDMTFTALERII
ncbi:hypothetical protein [Leifsonia sp. Leaf264]|uniref:hypothetical protein n=1 Tax=Leifsonia sp. Leaf264 TaxID=1736314 RepID=UPI0006FECF99|nr:hypothetical protein [Leifsonia sp. Leaf264]KQO98672.1 hypothetical protein ASF30_11460 [Leifsonia sp. Leaf264]